MFVSPEDIINSLNIKNGNIIADLGCGNGSYIFPCSKLVGENGKVYAIDLHEEILDKINRETEKFHISNIETILSDAQDRTHIESNSCDLVILSNLLSLVEDIGKVVEETKRILKQNGKVLVVDWKEGDSKILKNRNTINEQRIIAILAKYGLNVEKHLPAGDFHYAFLSML